MVNIVFLCVANSARSQIAEGLAKEILGNQAVIKSAGSMPSGKVNPFAIEVMREIGIDISDHTSKGMNDLSVDFIHKIDYVITLCAEETCPILPSTKALKLHWPNPDPATVTGTYAQKLQAFRTARQAIAERLKQFRSQLIID